LVYSTFLGGSSGAGAFAIALDTAGSIYVAGQTSSADFPTTAGAFDRSFNGERDGFVTKFDAAGTLAYSTYLGGSGDDAANAVAVDASGNAYMTGYTLSPDFPTTVGAFDRSANLGDYEAFVTKLDSAGRA